MKTVIESPYSEMLGALSSVCGYSDFVEFLQRDHDTTFWQTEIKALFESTSLVGHRLLKISSATTGGAEGVFHIAGQEALVETSEASFYADKNQTKQKCWNRLKYFVTPLQKYIPSGRTITLIANVDANQPSHSDAEVFKAEMQHVPLVPFSLSFCSVLVENMTFPEVSERYLTKKM